jgi:hypothetical protein
MRRPIASILALTLAFPPGLIAGEAAVSVVKPAETVARAFLDGKPLDQFSAEGLDAKLQTARAQALVVQKGPADGENANAYAERVRKVSRDLGLKETDIESAVVRYARRGTAGPAGATPNAELERRRTAESEARAAGASLRAKRIAGQFAAGAAPENLAAGAGSPGGSRGLTREQIRALNALPEAQSGPNLRSNSVAAPASGLERPWSDRMQDAASEKLRAAQGVPVVGSVGGWARKRWLTAQGVTQFIAGKAADGATWTALGNGAADLRSYPGYAWGAGKAIVNGVIEDFTNVYHDGATLIQHPNGANTASLTMSVGLLAVNFAGLGVPAAVKTTGKVAVEIAAKTAAEKAAKAAAELAAKESVEAATRTAARAEFRAANQALIESNLKLAGSAERAAAVRAQMPGLKDSQVKAVLRAHEEFPCAGAGCTHAHLTGKYKVMKEAGMSPTEIRETLDRGLAGKFADWWNDVATWKGAVKGFSLTSDGQRVVRVGSGALEGVTITADGVRLTAQLKRAATPANILPLGTLKVGGKILYPSQRQASATIISEYALKMTNGTWDWAKGSKIVLRKGPRGELVIQEGHHRVMAAVLADVPIPESAFVRTSIPNEAFDWKAMSWASQ